MNILYLCNDWHTTNVHRNLIGTLAKNYPENKFIVYVPLKKHLKFDADENLPNNVVLIERAILKRRHKYLFRNKINTVYDDVLFNIEDISKIDVVHCPTQCFMGSVAFKLNNKFGIPFIAAVRSTDDYYYRKMPWYRKLFDKPIWNSSFLIFLSEGFKNSYLTKHIEHADLDTIKSKSIVIPNGIDSIFLKNRKYITDRKPLNLLYYGQFIHRKNLHSIIEAVRLLNSKGYNLTLTCIGYQEGSGDYAEEIVGMASKYDWLRIRNKMSKEELLKEVNDFDIFVMASFAETFGLVYVEALTQGLPIVYSKGRGIDGYFTEGLVGHSVDPNSVEDILGGIERTIKEYDAICENIKNLDLSVFDWNNIASKYNSIYKDT